MTGSTLLLIHNIGFSISAVVGIGMAFFLIINNKRSVANITQALVFIAAAVFIISHVIGVNVSDPVLSEHILMFNLSIFFMGAFQVHSVLAFLKKDRKLWYIIALLYASVLFMVIFFLIHPDLFLLPSVPKMYLPDYYNPGILNWTRMVFVYGLCVPYAFVELVMAYRESGADTKKRNQIKYYILAIVCGYGVGLIPNFLVYNIRIDPLWGMLLLVFAAIPAIYDSMKYEFMDIKIVAKQALGYLVLIEIIGVFISLLIFFIDYIRQTFPDMPIWILPIVLAIVFVLTGAGVWRRLSETDVLKYEFITVITHKFRTPLTRIKWATEDIAGDVPLQKKENINTILESERQILAMTDTLVHLSAANVSNFDYHPSPINIESLFQDLSNQYSVRAERKGIRLSFSATPGMFIMVDAEKSSFIFQILLDNALSYTPPGGSIAVRACSDPNGKRGTIEVTDTGIGMSPETASRVFKRFYRGDNARRADTEGMGIGLFMVKSIVEKQNGKISIKSEGEGKGSTFSVRLPLYKNSIKGN